jgi:hypothetical protein
MSRVSVAALVCAAQFTMLLLKASGSPQIQSTTEPSFEVSTIKPVPPPRSVTLVGGSCHGTVAANSVWKSQAEARRKRGSPHAENE